MGGGGLVGIFNAVASGSYSTGGDTLRSRPIDWLY